MLGIIVINKPLRITSHDVVGILRRRLGTRRVGHSGTLDPLATGVLVVAVGPATRFLQYLPLEPKEYIGEVTFGKTTTTYDGEGEVIEERPVPADLEVRLNRASEKFVGPIVQLPPVYSAIKVNGKPMYEYARKGVEMERRPREVHIERFEILSVDGNVAKIKIVCSGGTYVRSLAFDLGEEIGCGAYLSGLVRSRVGKFGLEAAVLPDAATEIDLIPLSKALPPVPIVALNEGQVQHIREGRTIRLKNPLSAKLVALADPQGEVFSMGQCNGPLVKPECVIPASSQVEQ